MTGDSLGSDILGANKINAHNQQINKGPSWISIVVKTGLYKGDEFDKNEIISNPLFKPCFEVDNFEQAINLITKNEGGKGKL